MLKYYQRCTVKKKQQRSTMSLANWVQNTLKAAAEYIKRDKCEGIKLERVRAKKKPKARKKAHSSKKLKKAA
jgi:hypothetical protein